MVNISKADLMHFEERIKDLYAQGKIMAPIHLSGGNEDILMDLFKNIKKEDWVFASYRGHYHALLKGIPMEWLEQEIIKGRSMYIMNDEYKFYSSSIVPGQLPIALGVAMAEKMKGSGNHVWAFCGDMAAETGGFNEVIKYAAGHDLPITFIVEDDGLSVYTPTQEVWGKEIPVSHDNLTRLDLAQTPRDNSFSKRFMRYSYKRQYPHHGIGIWVEFPEDKKKNLPVGEEYIDKLKLSMKMLAEDKRIIFLGQTVRCKGSPIYNTLEGISEEKRIEMPIMEDVQMGISIGLSLGGFIPVSVYPRFDFLILAANQLVNHLDKIYELSNGRFNPKVIIRTMIGSKAPLYPGPQHFQDHTEAFKNMLTNVDVIKLEDKSKIISTYENALKGNRSTLIIEPVDLLHT